LAVLQRLSTDAAKVCRQFSLATPARREEGWERSRDGKQIYYLAADRRIMSVAVDTAHGDFSAGAARVLFQSDIVPDFRARFAVTADGQQFLIPSATGEGGAAVGIVIVNWMPASAK
jgi:hypothetical protein